jgi:hypothetical protein
MRAATARVDLMAQKAQIARLPAGRPAAVTITRTM